MDPPRKNDVIVHRIQIASGVQVAAGICARQADLRRSIEGRTSTHDHGSNRIALHPTRDVDRRTARKEERCSGETEAHRIQERRRNNVLFLDAEHLLTQRFCDQAERVNRGVFASLSSMVYAANNESLLEML